MIDGDEGHTMIDGELSSCAPTRCGLVEVARRLRGVEVARRLRGVIEVARRLHVVVEVAGRRLHVRG